MSQPPVRIAINGFGRIGRAILRIVLAGRKDAELVLINEIEPLETCAYLFEYDSIYGTWPGEVQTAPEMLIVDGRKVAFHSVSDLRELDLGGVDLVLECTGMAGKRAMSERGLQAGAKAVLVSGPAEEADVILVLGANDDLLADQTIISNSSCTTNALAPLARLLDEAYGIVSGHMTTVHCYTASQPTVDKPRGKLERSRAAALSMVPTTTSARSELDLVLPDLQGRIQSRAIRVPTASVSCVDLVVQTRAPVTVDGVNALLRTASEEGPYTNVFGWTERPLVSSDLRARSESVIMSGRETSVSEGGLLRVFGWYDNEWGFSCRMLDMAVRMGERLKTTA